MPDRLDPAMGHVWRLPVLPALPTQTWIDQIATAAGVPLRQKALGPAMLRFVGLFMPEAGEVVEMLYQWRRPFVLDDSRFRAAFGAAPTPMHEMVATTVAWARETYAPARSGASYLAAR